VAESDPTSKAILKDAIGSILNTPQEMKPLDDDDIHEEKDTERGLPAEDENDDLVSPEDRQSNAINDKEGSHKKSWADEEKQKDEKLSTAVARRKEYDRGVQDDGVKKTDFREDENTNKTRDTPSSGASKPQFDDLDGIMEGDGEEKS
jgi:hypothetical protein